MRLDKATRRAALRGIGAVSVLAMVSACSSGVGGDDGSVTLRLASPLPEAGSHGQSLQHWADAVEEESDGDIQIEISPSGSLLAGTDILAGVGDGRADLGLTYSNYHPEEMPLWNVVGIPFLADTWTATANAYDILLEESEELQAEFEGANVRPLFTVPNGSASSGAKEPINTLSDLDGKRYRIPGTMADIAAGAGLDSVFLELAEMYEGLERGVVDGWMGTEFASAMSLSLQEVTPEFTDIGLGQYASAMVFVGEDIWDSLSEEQQQVLTDVSADYPAELVDLITEIESEACDALLDEGGSVHILPESESQKLADRVESTVTDKLRAAAEERGVDGATFDEYVARFTELMTTYEDPTEYVDGQRACAEH